MHGKFLIIFQSPVQISSAFQRFPAPLPLRCLPGPSPPPERVEQPHALYRSWMEADRVIGISVCPAARPLSHFTCLIQTDLSQHQFPFQKPPLMESVLKPTNILI